MEWFTEEQRERRERYKQKLAPFNASMERLGEHGKAMQKGGKRMARTGIMLMFGILVLGVFVAVIISIL